MTPSIASMLTLQEVAALLRISTRTVRRWVNNGTIPAHKFGRQWRVALVDLEDFRRAHLCRRSSFPSMS